MSLLRLWAPGLLLTWQPLWLLVQAAQPLESPQDPLQLTAEHPGPIKPWSLLSSELPPLLPHELTPSADPGVFDDLGSSARSQMLDSPRKLTDSLLPFLGRVSPGEPAPEVDQFAVQDQFAASRQTNSEREAPRIGSNARLKSKLHTVNLDQSTDHQSFEVLVPPLDSQSAKAAKFIVSPLNLKKDVAQHPRFAKVVGGTPKQFAKLQLQNNLQDDYVYPSTDVASSGNLPPESQENSEESPETPDQVEPSVEAQETPEELQSSSSQQEVPEDQEALGGEASMHHKLSSLRSDTQPVVTSKPADLVTVTPQADKEIHLPSGQEQAPTQPSEGLEVVEPSSTQQEAPAQTSELSEPSLAEQETPVQAPKSPMENIAETLPTLPVVPSLGQDQVHYYNLPSVTGRPADVEITITSEPTKEAESSLAQQEAPVQPEAPVQEARVQEASVQEAPVQEAPVQEAPVQEAPVQEAPVQPPEYAEEVEPSLTQQETPAQPPGPPVETEPSLSEQETPTEPSESPGEDQSSESQLEVPMQSLDLPSVTGEPADVLMTITPEPTTEVGTSLINGEAIVPPSIPTNDLGPSASQPEAPTVPPELPNDVGRSPEGEDVTGSSLGSDQAESPTPELNSEVEISVQQETLDESSVSPEQLEPQPSPPLEEEQPPIDQEVPSQLEELPEESLSSQQESSSLPSMPPVSVELPPVQETLPTKPPESTFVPTIASFSDSMSFSPQDLEVMFTSGSSNLPKTTVQHVALIVTVPSEATKEVEPVSTQQVTFYPTQSNAPSQSPGFPENFGFSSAQQATTTQMETSTEVLSQNQAQDLTSPSVTFQPLDLELTSTPKPTKHSRVKKKPVALSSFPIAIGTFSISLPTVPVFVFPTMQKTSTLLPKYQEGIIPTQETSTQPQVLIENQVHYSTVPSLTFKPVEVQLPITPEPNVKVEHPTAFPPKPHDVELTITPEPNVGVEHPTAFPPKPHDVELTITPEPNVKVEHPTAFPPKPHDVELTITPEPNVGVKHPTAFPLKPHEVTLLRPHQGTTNPPPKPPETTFPHLDLETTNLPPEPPDVTFPRPYQKTTNPQINHKETSVIAQSFQVEITRTSKPNVDVASSQTLPGKPIQLPEPYKEIIAKPPVYYEITLPTISTTPVSESSSVGVQPADMTITLTPLPSVATESSTTPTTLSTTETTSQQTNMTEFTVAQVKPDQTTTHFPEIYATEKEENVTKNTSICELCTCQDETLLCVGLAPMQKLHRVPVLEPYSYNGNFTVL
ncbi:Hypothetical predicted protein [Marmota monax]|uniref:Leucine-rich repeat-containing protein 37 N-terminal domain-containing protein n=1 Tax=Marmota monax TaxID=9995 RepID=A0A5E4BQR2_MARMO|nr:Hypothetical predicted protein [Marmota monax]